LQIEQNEIIDEELKDLGFLAYAVRRFFVVERRDRETLIPIIQKQAAVLGTTIATDEWKSPYVCLKHIGFIHYTVKHSQNFIDPITGY